MVVVVVSVVVVVVVVGAVVVVVVVVGRNTGRKRSIKEFLLRMLELIDFIRCRAKTKRKKKYI